MKLPVSVIIIAQNEAPNIGFAISSVIDHFDQVILVDSFSTDDTPKICGNYSGLEFFQHEFLDWASQKNWALENCKIRNGVVLFLDADEYITSEFVSELSVIVESGVDFAAIYLNPSYIFLGRKLKYAYGHPKIRRIFKVKGLKYYCEGARDHSVSPSGPLLHMAEPFIHHDRKPFSAWVQKQVRNAYKEARFYLSSDLGQFNEDIPADLRFRRGIRANIWNRLPLFVRPFLYFFYKYVVRLGFMDGRAGLVYCFMHGLWYQMLVDIAIVETRLNKS